MPPEAAIAMDNEIYRDLQKVSRIACQIPDLFGVEVELEGRGVHGAIHHVSEYFTTHADNSLRNIREDSENIEYVFSQPLEYETTVKAVKLLLDYLNSDKAEVFESYRTSFHIHVNCAKETYRTVYNYITLAIIFDELFTSQNGDHRIGNNFCLRARDAEAQIVDLVASIKADGSFFGIQPNHRYSSVNFASLLKFGTIEFRSLECTTNFRRVKHWIDTVQFLKEFARTFDNPRAIISDFSVFSPDMFITNALGPFAAYYQRVPDWEVMLRNGMRLAQDFAYCHSWVPSNKEPKPKAKPITLADVFAAQAAAMNAGGQPGQPWDQPWMNNIINPQPVGEPVNIIVEGDDDDEEEVEDFDFNFDDNDDDVDE